MSLIDKFIFILAGFSLFSLFVLFRIVIHVRKKKKKWPKLLKATGLIVALGLAVIAYGFLLEPNWIKTDVVTIKDSQLTEALQGLVVLQISDLHVKKIGFREKKLINDVNKLKPDILFITGDLFNKGRGQDALSEFEFICELIGNMKATVGIFGSLGNYDSYLQRHKDKLRKLQAAGLNMLVKESREIQLPNNKTIWLAGCNYEFHNKYSDSYYKKCTKDIPSGSPVILLNHYPDVFTKANETGINLVLAGHTHGGQIGIPFLVQHSHSANKSSFMQGLFDTGKTKMYVNRGIGTVRIPVRLFRRPEITIFKFVTDPQT